MSKVIARERIWATSNRKTVCPEGHPDAAVLLYTPGKRISEDDVARYGLAGGVIGGTAAARAAEAEAAKLAKAGENKSGKAGENKGNNR